MATAVPARIDDRKSFQKLKTTLHRRIVDALDLSTTSRLDEEGLRQQVRGLATRLCLRDDAHVPADMRETMIQEILDEIYGFGPLEPLMNDADVSDVLVNGPDSVWVERGGLLQETDVRFADEAHLLQLIHRLVARTGRRIDDLSPMVEGKLPDGSRLNAVIAPLAARGATLSIRRFKPQVLQFEEMVALGTLAPEMADFLIACVLGRLNLLISGGGGAGKTTLLNNLGRFIAPSERIVTIEQTAELALPQGDVVSLETRPANVEGRGEVSSRDLLKHSLRMRPDRILVGEARGAEVLDLLQAMNTGHDGSMSTVHANDTREALDRLELMIALSGIELATAVARQYIASAVQILVHIARLPSGARKVIRISEVRGYRDGAYQIEDIFVYRTSGSAESGRMIGTFYATGYEPASLARLAGRGVELERGMFVPRELNA